MFSDPNQYPSGVRVSSLQSLFTVVLQKPNVWDSISLEKLNVYQIADTLLRTLTPSTLYLSDDKKEGVAWLQEGRGYRLVIVKGGREVKYFVSVRLSALTGALDVTSPDGLALANHLVASGHWEKYCLSLTVDEINPIENSQTS